MRRAGFLRRSASVVASLVAVGAMTVAWAGVAHADTVTASYNGTYVYVNSTPLADWMQLTGPTGSVLGTCRVDGAGAPRCGIPGGYGFTAPGLAPGQYKVSTVRDIGGGADGFFTVSSPPPPGGGGGGGGGSGGTAPCSTLPRLVSPPTLSTNNPVEGQTITATTGSWDGACRLNIVWYGCTSSTNCWNLYTDGPSHTIVANEVGDMLRVKVQAFSNAGEKDVNSSLTQPVLHHCTPIAGTTAASPNGWWLSSDPGSISRPGDGANDVFEFGIDGNLYHVQWCDNGGWGGWESFGKPAVGLSQGVDVASAGPTHMDVFAVGGDGALWHRYWNGRGWSGWETLGAPVKFVSAPTAVARPTAGAIDVFVNGSDHNVWQLEWHNGWGAWKSIGHPFLAATGGLDVLSMSGTHMDLFTRSGFDASLWHDIWNGTSWSGWAKLGGSGFTADPTAVARPGANAFDVFVPQQDGTIWRITWNQGVWSSFSSVGAPPVGLFGGADVASAGPKHLDLFVRGKDLSLWHDVWNGSTWSGWYTLNQPARS